MVFLFIISSLIYFNPAPPCDFHATKIITENEEWSNLLRKYVTAGGYVNYRGLKTETTRLNAYLDYLQKNPPAADSEPAVEMAYWINAYNAFTVDLVLKNYPLKSIKDIEGGKPWDLAFISIGGKKYSLNNIEHDILRKKFSDPRIHFAINCASRSCPRLMNSAFNAAQLDQQLDSMAKVFINDPSKNKIAADKIEISQLFDWYKNDFSKNGTLITFLNKYAVTKILPAAQISYLDYDWSLNESI